MIGLSFGVDSTGATNKTKISRSFHMAADSIAHACLSNHIKFKVIFPKLSADTRVSMNLTHRAFKMMLPFVEHVVT